MAATFDRRKRWPGRILGCFTVCFVAAIQGQAQLDFSCMVSALNRTAPVQADGIWVLPNVPANLGQVRVRATCVDEGTVSFGASSLINVPANGVIKIEEIQFQGPPPIPSALSLSAPQTTLTAIAQTAQLAALATFPGGATMDVTLPDKGTDYRTSNPAIASVEANGLVTAQYTQLYEGSRPDLEREAHNSSNFKYAELVAQIHARARAENWAPACQ